MSASSLFSGLLTLSADAPEIVPPEMVTSMLFFVTCCTTAIPAPVVVAPFAFDATANGDPVPVMLAFPETFSVPERISTPVTPSIAPPLTSSVPVWGW